MRKRYGYGVIEKVRTLGRGEGYPQKLMKKRTRGGDFSKTVRMLM